MRKKRIHIKDIQPLKESYPVPEGYFDSLADKIETNLAGGQVKKGEKDPLIRLEDIIPLKENFEVPEGYFEGLMEKIEERKILENNVIAFRKRKIRIWGSFVAAACIAMVVVSVINFGPETSVNLPVTADIRLKNISDREIAFLLNERDDEFELTDEEIIEVIEHETMKSESTAIINFLEDDGALEDGSEEDFLESI